MNKLNPIGIETQIDNVLFGQSEEEAKQVADKIQKVAAEIDQITSINGKKVYNVTTDGEVLYYSLRPKSPAKYHYPIQYAEIGMSQGGGD